MYGQLRYYNSFLIPLLPCWVAMGDGTLIYKRGNDGQLFSVNFVQIMRELRHFFGILCGRNWEISDIQKDELVLEESEIWVSNGVINKHVTRFCKFCIRFCKILVLKWLSTIMLFSNKYFSWNIFLDYNKYTLNSKKYKREFMNFLHASKINKRHIKQ